MVGQGFGFLPLCAGIGLGLLLGQLTRMHNDHGKCLLGDTPIAVFDLHLSEHALTMPASGGLGLRSPGLLHQQRQRGLLLSPRFEFLPHRIGAGDQRYQANAFFQTQP